MRTTLLTIAASIALTTHGFCADATPSPTPQPDKLKDALAELITGVTQTASDAKSFVVVQLPDVVRQLLAWKFATSIIYTLLAIIFLYVAITICRKSLKDEVFKDDGTVRYDVHPQCGWARFVLGVASCFATVVGIIWVIIALTNPTWLQIWLAPKVYLIEYAKDLIHK